MFSQLMRLRRRTRRIARAVLNKELLQGRQTYRATERHGSEYGGWTVVAGMLDAQSIVYSVGIGDDISFDLSLISSYGLTIHAFDPTPRSVEWIRRQALPPQFLFHQIGIADFDGIATFYAPTNPEFISFSLSELGRREVSNSIDAPVCRLETAMKELGHEKIDLLKMDIEGAEYAVLKDLIDRRLRVTQILVEFHHRFSSINADQTRSAIHALNHTGYQIFFVSDSGEEYSFLRMSDLDW